jgi:tRNA/rRNA methyltransferase
VGQGDIREKVQAPDSIGTRIGAAPAWAERARRVRFVLVEPSHCGNIGASARAIRTMGFSTLAVVAPKEPAFRGSEQALALAANAQDVLRAASLHDTTVQALRGVSLAIAMTGYPRQFGPPHVELREAAARACRWLGDDPGDVALLFGTERSGLLNQDVQRCQLSCAIGTDPAFDSLNLSQAVQVAAYVLRGEMGSREPAPGAAPAGPPQPGIEQAELFYGRLEQALQAVGFHDPARPRHLMARLRALFGRAAPNAEEMDILLGICAAIIEPKALRAGRKVGSGQSRPRED